MAKLGVKEKSDIHRASSALVAGTAVGGVLVGTLPNPSGLATTGVIPGSYGDSTHIASFTVGADGRLTSVTPVGIAIGWTTLSKSVSQAVQNNAVLQNDTVLTFPMVANTNYRIRGVIYLSGSSTAAGMQYGFTGPSSPSSVRFSRRDNANGGGLTDRATDTSIPGATALTVGTSANAECVMFSGIVANGVNAGNFTFQFAQSVATPLQFVTCLQGSYMEYSVA